MSLIIYYSGEASRANPEIVLGDKANVMLTFYDMFKKGCTPTRRFGAILRSRIAGKTTTTADGPPVGVERRKNGSDPSAYLPKVQDDMPTE